MAFTVQTDDGLTAGANSYDSVANYESYWTDRGVDLSSYTTEQKEASLIQGTFYVDNRYDYIGYRLNGFSQTTEWPRGDAWVLVGNTWEKIEGVPQCVKNACFEYAYRNLTGTDLQPDGNAEGAIKKKKEQVGPLSEETEYCGCGSTGGTIAYPSADNWLENSGLVKSTNGLYERY